MTLETSPTEKQIEEQRKIDIRMTNPEAYRDMMTHSFISIGLAINFWNSHPTFNPFGWPKTIVGFVFFIFGVLGLTFLVAVRNLHRIRLLFTFSFIWYFGWGVVNAQQWHQHKASLQLPIILIGLAVLQFLVILKPAFNPMTARKR